MLESEARHTDTTIEALSDADEDHQLPLRWEEDGSIFYD